MLRYGDADWAIDSDRSAQWIQWQQLTGLRNTARKLDGVVFCEIRENRLECGILTRPAAAKVRRVIAPDAPFPEPADVDFPWRFRAWQEAGRL